MVAELHPPGGVFAALCGGTPGASIVDSDSQNIDVGPPVSPKHLQRGVAQGNAVLVGDVGEMTEVLVMLATE